jgi:hypothetical protein
MPVKTSEESNEEKPYISIHERQLIGGYSVTSLSAKNAAGEKFLSSISRALKRKLSKRKVKPIFTRVKRDDRGCKAFSVIDPPKIPIPPAHA